MGWVRLQVACRCLNSDSLDSFYLPGPWSFSCSFPVLLLPLSYPLVQELAYIYEGVCRTYIQTHTRTVTYTYTLGISPYLIHYML